MTLTGNFQGIFINQSCGVYKRLKETFVQDSRRIGTFVENSKREVTLLFKNRRIKAKKKG